MSFDPKGVPPSDKSHFTILDMVRTVFAEAGYEVQTVEQDGRLRPDAIATPKPSLMAERDDTPARVQTFSDRELTIKVMTGAISSTTEILRRLQNAVNANRRCIFVVPEGETENDKTRRAKALEAALRSRDAEKPSITNPSDDDEWTEHPQIGIAHYHEGVQQYHQTTQELRVNDGAATALQPRKAVSGLWFRQADGRIEYRLVEQTPDGQTDDEPYIWFKNHEKLQAGRGEHIGAMAERSDGGYVVTEVDGTVHRYGSFEMVETEWKTVPMPFVPKIAFKHPPTPADYSTIVADPTASNSSDKIQLYDGATDTTKLFTFR